MASIMPSMLKLVQFHSASSNKQRLDLLKEVDVSYSVPNDEHPEVKPRNSYAGYSYLHFAVKKSDINCITELLNCGADLLKQGTQDGFTPLHLAFDSSPDIASKKIWDLQGVLLDNQIVNTLLSAQVTSGKTVNPKCLKNGTSHLHIACMFNHAKAVDFLVKSGASVHETTNLDSKWLPGYTALHFAVRYSSVEAAAVLLKNGADIEAKDARGISVLHVLIKRLIDVTDYLLMGRQAISLPYKIEIQRIESIIISVIKTRKIDMSLIDESGFTAFHLACTVKDLSFVEYFLQQNFDLNVPVNNNSKLCPEWTPLHFAACFSIETFKLIMINKANVNIQCTNGLTALNLFTRRHTPDVIHSTLSVIDEFSTITLTDQSTKLSDIILSMNSLEDFDVFLKSLPDVNISVPDNSPIWPGYSLLHLAVMMNERTKEYKDFKEKSNSSDFYYLQSQVYNCTKLQEEAYIERIKMLLSKKANVDVINAEGLSPLHMAFQLLSNKAVQILITKTSKNLVAPSSLSHFHIACAANHYTTHVKRLLSQGVDINARVNVSFVWYFRPIIFLRKIKRYLIPATANWTPLHIAVVCGSFYVVTCLLENGADVYAKDAHGMTPIHLCMSLQEDSTTIARMIFGKTKNLRDSVTSEGLSHLHVAAFANDGAAIEQLLKNGANVNVRFDVPSAPRFFSQLEDNLNELLFTAYYAGETPLHIATRQNEFDAVRALIVKGNADIHAESSNHRGTSPLHYALDRITEDHFQYYAKQLKREGKDYIGPLDDSNVTMLHVACAMFDFKWAKQLLKNGADINAKVRNDNEYVDEWCGDTPLHALVSHATLEDTLPENFMSMVELLLKNDADVTALNSIGTPIHVAAEVGYPNLFFKESDEQLFMREIADMLLRNQKNFNVNPVDSRGISHFHYACFRNEVVIVQEFLDHGVDINQSNNPFADVNPGFRPLHYALAYGSIDVAKVLIQRGADLMAQDQDGNTPLHVYVKTRSINTQMIDLMLSHGMDINAKNLDGATPLKCLFLSFGLTLAALDYFLSHNSSLDIGSNEEAINLTRSVVQHARPKEVEVIFRRLVSKFNIEVKIKEGFNAIHSLVSAGWGFNLTRKFYQYAIQQFVEMGCDFDRRDSDGKTALHRAIEFHSSEGVEALLLLGADIDVVDNENEYLLTDEMIVEYVSGEFEEDDDQKYNVIERLAEYVWKMQFIGLSISKHMMEASQAVMNKIPYVESEIEKFNIELEKMNGINITENITVKDFLTDWAVRDYPSKANLQRSIIDEFFKKVDWVNNEFPAFSGILLLQYRKAIARMKLYELAVSALISLISIALPYFCLDLILREFTNEELQYFVDIADDIHRRY